MRADNARRLGRAGERHHIKGSQRIHQSRRASRDDRQCTGGQHPCVHHVLHHALGQPCRGCAWLDDDRHARKQGGRGFFPQAPSWKVERVDAQRHPWPRHLQVLRLKDRFLAQPDRVPVAQHAYVAQRLTPFGVLAEREDAAVDVHRRVRLDGAGIGGGDVVVAVAVRLQHLGDRAEHGGPLTIGGSAQRSPPLFAGKRKGLGQIQPRGVHPHQGGAQHRIAQLSAGPRSVLPAAGNVVGEQFSHAVVLSEQEGPWGEQRRRQP